MVPFMRREARSQTDIFTRQERQAQISLLGAYPLNTDNESTNRLPRREQVPRKEAWN